MNPPKKPQVIAALLAALTTELAAVERVAAMARDEATNAETRQEGKYDTRATEASYLARGQAQRVVALRRLVGWFGALDPSAPPAATARVGALVTLDGPRRELLFLAPVGGTQIDMGGHRVRVISPSSPLGQALCELGEGELAEVVSPRGIVEYTVATIE